MSGPVVGSMLGRVRPAARCGGCFVHRASRFFPEPISHQLCYSTTYL